jgi:16S rRNA (guanine966-N2)-methyltransferase
MRIVAGAWRGRTLAAPAGQTTRPTSDRVRQALFDMLLHAPWGGRALIENASVLDGFAGTGALGLEALSRGAASVNFYETDHAALVTLRDNIGACHAEARCRILAGSILNAATGTPCGLIFLDPPYGAGLLAPALARLTAMGWLAPAATIVAEIGRDEPIDPAVLSGAEPLAERIHGAARLVIWRPA